MAHDPLLFLTARGRAHCIPTYRVPEASRTAGGTAIAQVWPRLPRDLCAACRALQTRGSAPASRPGCARQPSSSCMSTLPPPTLCVTPTCCRCVTPTCCPSSCRHRQLLGLEAGDSITAMIPLGELAGASSSSGGGSDGSRQPKDDEAQFVVMATQQVCGAWQRGWQGVVATLLCRHRADVHTHAPPPLPLNTTAAHPSPPRPQNPASLDLCRGGSSALRSACLPAWPREH